MATQIVPAPERADHAGQTAPLPVPAVEALARLELAFSCSARTPRGMRTPTGDYMNCAGGHAPGDLHGASFGAAGWVSWSDGSAVTA